MTQTEKIHYRGCTLCEAMCGLEIRVDGAGAITSIRGDEADPLSRGHICPKGVALQDIYNDPDRLRQPVRRTPAGDFEKISWTEALDAVAAGIRGVQERHGKDAMAVYSGNPNAHNHGALLFGPQFLRLLRTKHRYSATSVDQLPHHLMGYLCFGHMLLLPIPDIDRTQYFLAFGGNPLVSNGSLMTAPDIKKRLKAIGDRGGKVVVVDPRRTETARLAHEHVAVRPGTDVFVLLGMIHTLYDDGLTAPGRLAAFTSGLDDVEALAARFAPEKTAAATGVSAETVRRLAREVAAAESAVCYGRMGVSVQEFGSQCQWLLMLLNLLTGNLDREGGSLFTKPAADIVDAKHGRGSFGRWRSRVRELPEFGGELPVATMAEDMLEPGDGQIRGLFTSAGNPVLSTPDGQRLDRALEGLEFMASLDIYINETTRHADIILPSTSPLEHDHYDLVFHLLAIRNTARYTPALFEPPDGALHDWQIFLGLIERLDPKPAMKTRLMRAFQRRKGPAGIVDVLLRTGPYGGGLAPWASGLTLKTLKQHPHGIDLGPLQPSMPERLRTRSGRIEAAPKELLDDSQRLDARLDELLREDGRSLVLISRRQVRSNNSWMHNHQRLMRGKDRCTLLMHPDDAARLGVTDGLPVEITSRVGAVQAPLEVSDEMMPGVVSLPHGWGHGRRGVELAVATEQPGVSINDLTDAAAIDPLTGNAALSGVPVRVAAADAVQVAGG